MMLGSGSGGHEGSKQNPKLGDKVYARKSFKGLKSFNSNPSQEQAEAEEDDEWSQPLVNSLPNAFFNRGVGMSNERGKLGLTRLDNRVTISLAMKSKQEMRELRRKLQSELDVIRSLARNIESKEAQKKVPEGSWPLHQLSVSVLENSHGVSDNAEKEKRTPKANQFYRNSDFLLAKDKIPPPDSNKKIKSNVKKVGGVEPLHGFGLGKSNQVFKNCCALLERLMKHKHGWVFNKPVDTVGLGLHDYFDIIKHPMDLGTVKSRLDSNWYKSPREFAEDVRLTFQNAMKYNPKGQDVHVMAEQLLQIFENKWPTIEADYMREMRLAMDYEVGLPTPTSKKGPKFANPEMRRNLGRSESMTLPIDPKPKPMNPPHTGRTPAPKKPKAKEPNKRDMTFDEKQKLNVNLQNLPSEKLENVVQIIKKRNSSLCQHDDEIEVDIDSLDVETLWELDRFVTNYKKSSGKNKRKTEQTEIAAQLIKEAAQNTELPEIATQPIKEAEQNTELPEIATQPIHEDEQNTELPEIATQPINEDEQNVQDKNDSSVVEETTAAAVEETTAAVAEEITAAVVEEITAAAAVEETMAAAVEETTAAAVEETPTEIKADEGKDISSAPAEAEGEKQENDATKSSSSSSDSGSSSSDSHSESSSEGGSDAEHSPKTEELPKSSNVSGED